MSSKRNINATKKETTPALVPKLRFPKFRDADGWHIRKLSSLVQLVSGTHLSPEQYSTEGAVPYFTGPSDFTNDIEAIAKRTSDSTSLATENDTLITVKGSGVGEIWYLTLPSVGIGRQLMAVHAIDAETRFIFQFLLSKKRRFEDLAAGNLIPGLSRGDILDLEAPFPERPEQQKIAECLSSVDELIASHTRKVDALKTHKKGLMQQLFPRNDQARPRLRFPEFRNAGEWEMKMIGDVFKVTRGEVLAMTLVKDEASDDAPYPVYSSQTKNKGLAGYYSEHLYEEAITWTTDGANAGDVNFRPGKFYCTNVCGVLMSTEGYANSCIAALLNSVARSHVSYVGNPKLMNGVMAKIEIPFPSLPEQQRIASCLSSFDALITDETQKLETLKSHKKGLMQQLFPSPEDEA